jgi:cell division protein FtsB
VSEGKRRSSRSTGAQAAPRSAGWIFGRVALAAAVIAAVMFAVQGGEYGTTDLIGQRGTLARERASVDSLEKRVAELDALKKAIERDPVTQERIAREEFGMVKPGEVLYRFTEPADTSR